MNLLACLAVFSACVLIAGAKDTEEVVETEEEEDIDERDAKPKSVLISKGKKATQSSTKFKNGPQLAIDGKYNQMLVGGSCSHTNLEKNPWWQVDLKSKHIIHYVKVWNRADCCGERLNSLKVESSSNGKKWKVIGRLKEKAKQGKVYTIHLKPGSVGRYVRLSLAKDKADYLTLCEVEVWGLKSSHGDEDDEEMEIKKLEETDDHEHEHGHGHHRKKKSKKENHKKIVLLSRGKKSSQSSTGFGGPAKLGNDGKRNQHFSKGKTCTHTKREKHPWWKVDLGATHIIKYVKVWNRGDCCGGRLTSLIIEGSVDNKHWIRIGALQGHAKNGKVYIIDTKGLGRYIRLSLSKRQADFLSLCEVEIYGRKSRAKLISRRKKSSQSSVLNKGYASLANDGIYHQNYRRKSCTHTKREKRPWWKVDLGKKYKLSYVRVWNRGDCCGNRLTSLIVESSTDNKKWKRVGALKGNAKRGGIYTILTRGSGRYVRLSLSKRTAEYFTLCEVEIYGTEHKLVLLSRGKKVSQSSVADKRHAKLAIDGKRNQHFVKGKTCTLTKKEKRPWWKVDLGAKRRIDHVKVWNRGDCCGERLTSLIVEASNDNKRWKTIGKLKGKAKSGKVYTIKARGRARYVRLSLKKKTAEVLTLCEVEVYGKRPKKGRRKRRRSRKRRKPKRKEKFVLLSRGKKVSQSSVADRRHAKLAIDGKRNQHFVKGKTCTLTKKEKRPWWKVDLGAKHRIDHVKVWNRADCCGERLTSLIVEASNDNKKWKTIGKLQGRAKSGKVYTIKARARARYVRLSLKKKTAEVLTLCEVEVYGKRSKKKKHQKKKFVLLSRGKKSWQSSVAHRGLAKFANDGKHHQNYYRKSCTHTKKEKHPWWKVDLGANYDVHHVKVWNRGDCCGRRLTSLIVEASVDNTKWKRIGKLKGVARNGGVYTIKAKGRARYVRLSLGKKTADYLTLCEVEVYGKGRKSKKKPKRKIVLLSRRKKSWQSSVSHGGLAKLANDGKHHQNYRRKTCTHTKREKHPWWKVDLGAKYDVRHVKVWNRGDCCGSRLTSLIVEASVDNKKWKRIGRLKGKAKNGGVYTIKAKGRARYVRLSLGKKTADYLTLCEVEVYGKKPKSKKKSKKKAVLISRGKKVSQSSEAFKGSAKLANDGKRNQNNSRGKTCANTKKEKHPWWKVDLGGRHHISYVKVWNRGDCCGNRLTSLIIESSRDNKKWKKIGTLKGKAKSGGVYTIKASGEGRYVRLKLGKKTSEYLTLCEVEVYGRKKKSKKRRKPKKKDKVKLISRGKKASQSSVAYNGLAKLAVDGKRKQNFYSGTCTHTKKEKRPWWKVDLGISHHIHHVKVWNRGDCCGERLASLQVESSFDNERWKVIGKLKGRTKNGGVYTIKTKGIGKYVRLRLSKKKADYLSLCEVEVYGRKDRHHRARMRKAKRRPKEKAVLLSRGKPVTQSSDKYNGLAKFAVDGKYFQNYFRGSCSHTNQEQRPWWKVDLGKSYHIDRVKVWNRADCCGEQLTSLKVESSANNKRWKKIGALEGKAESGKVYTIKTKGKGRFVRLSLSKKTPGVLTLCEVEVFGRKGKSSKKKKKHAKKKHAKKKHLKKKHDDEHGDSDDKKHSDHAHEKSD